MGFPRSLAIVGVLLGSCLSTTAFAADVAITAKSREHFKAGVSYLDDPQGAKYEEAYREFHLAYAESPSYKILNNIAICALNLERDGEAIQAYEQFLAHATTADIPPAARDRAERDVAMLKASLVRVTITAQPSALTVTDERQPAKGVAVINYYTAKDGKLEIGMHPGRHRVVASAEGFESQEWIIEESAAGQHSHAFQLKAVSTTQPTGVLNTPIQGKPESTVSSGNNTMLYVGLAATGVFAGGAIVAGLLERRSVGIAGNLAAIVE